MRIRFQSIQVPWTRAQKAARNAKNRAARKARRNNRH